mmetsp:Transcript_51882/g.130276  ORF Transcript_51882/g.130276 Transcript_51882/m.130276 type:complete len:205 (-) Transcript_51882:493-1107(-)
MATTCGWPPCSLCGGSASETPSLRASDARLSDETASSAVSREPSCRVASKILPKAPCPSFLPRNQLPRDVLITSDFSHCRTFTCRQSCTAPGERIPKFNPVAGVAVPGAAGVAVAAAGVVSGGLVAARRGGVQTRACGVLEARAPARLAWCLCVCPAVDARHGDGDGDGDGVGDREVLTCGACAGETVVALCCWLGVWREEAAG